MKRALSIFLCIVSIITCVLPFAAFTKDNKRSTAYTLTVDKAATAKFVSKDYDYNKWFKFTAPKKAIYKFTVENPQSSSSYIDVYNSNGKLLQDEYYDNFAENITVYISCAKDAVYYLRFRDYIEKSYTVKITAAEHKHSYVTDDVDEATTTSNGTLYQECVCGKSREVAIAKASKISLSATSYTYNGKKKTPTITVKDSTGKALKKNTDYKISGTTSATKAGSYSIKITLKGNYSGSKTLKWKIVPAQVTGLTVTKQAANSISLKWNKAAGATGYIIYGNEEDGDDPYYYKAATVTTTSAKVTKIYGYSLYSAEKYSFYVVPIAKSGSTTVSGKKSATVSTATTPGKTSLDLESDYKGEIEVDVYSYAYDNITGYQIYTATSSNGPFTKVKTIKSSSESEYVTLTGLKPKATYYVKARAYWTVNGKTLYGAFSDIKSIKVSSEEY